MSGGQDEAAEQIQTTGVAGSISKDIEFGRGTACPTADVRPQPDLTRMDFGCPSPSGLQSAAPADPEHRVRAEESRECCQGECGAYPPGSCRDEVAWAIRNNERDKALRMLASRLDQLERVARTAAIGTGGK